jgi:hypothetical protein
MVEMDYAASVEATTFIVIISSTKFHDTLIRSSESETSGCADIISPLATSIYV